MRAMTTIVQLPNKGWKVQAAGGSGLYAEGLLFNKPGTPPRTAQSFDAETRP
jgi:hypothetical protein